LMLRRICPHFGCYEWVSIIIFDSIITKSVNIFASCMEDVGKME
jgi:hypothetical protein